MIIGIVFLNGYGINKAQFNKMLPQINQLGLLQATDKLRWAIDKKPEKIDEFTEKLLSKLSNLT